MSEDPTRREPTQPESTTPSGDRGTTDRPLRVAYVMSRFPKITETFVLREILAVRRPGLEVELFPLILEKGVVERRVESHGGNDRRCGLLVV